MAADPPASTPTVKSETPVGVAILTPAPSGQQAPKILLKAPSVDLGKNSVINQVPDPNPGSNPK